MKKDRQQDIGQPLGRILSNTGKNFLNLANQRLDNLEIKRNFYALTLIENGHGEITQKELAYLLDSDKVSIVRIIDYLSEKGYVTRVKNTTDKRKYSLRVTEKAKMDLPNIKKTLIEVTEIAFKGLSLSQVDEFLRTLNIIKYNLNK
jgi:MarR family transcriptional regulator, transcriptional regulator for hemolysin